jgi:hypothetical protein
MTEETTTKDVIVYTIQEDNKINIIGEFENITLCVIDCNHDPYIEGETQVAFVLEDGVIKHKELEYDEIVRRRPKVNISYDSYEIDFNTNKIIGDVKGRYDLVRCALNSISTGDIVGRKVVSLRVEGVAEYIKFIPQTVEDFITSNK